MDLSLSWVDFNLLSAVSFLVLIGSLMLLGTFLVLRFSPIEKSFESDGVKLLSITLPSRCRLDYPTIGLLLIYLSRLFYSAERISVKFC